VALSTVINLFSLTPSLMPIKESLSLMTGVSPIVTWMDACAAMGRSLDQLLIGCSIAKTNGMTVKGGSRADEVCKVVNIALGYKTSYCVTLH